MRRGKRKKICKALANQGKFLTRPGQKEEEPSLEGRKRGRGHRKLDRSVRDGFKKGASQVGHPISGEDGCTKAWSRTSKRSSGTELTWEKRIKSCKIRGPGKSDDGM